MARFKKGDLVRICVKNSSGKVFENDTNHGKMGLILGVKEFLDDGTKKDISNAIYTILIDEKKYFYGEHCLRSHDKGNQK